MIRREPNSLPGQGFSKTAAQVFAVALLYWLAAVWGVKLAVAGGNISPVWPATGIAIAAVYHTGVPRRPGSLAGWLGRGGLHRRAMGCLPGGADRQYSRAHHRRGLAPPFQRRRRPVPDGPQCRGVFRLGRCHRDGVQRHAGCRLDVSGRARHLGSIRPPLVHLVVGQRHGCRGGCPRHPGSRPAPERSVASAGDRRSRCAGHDARGRFAVHLRLASPFLRWSRQLVRLRLLYAGRDLGCAAVRTIRLGDRHADHLHDRPAGNHQRSRAVCRPTKTSHGHCCSCSPSWAWSP